jgi:pyruvate,water dikinase
MSSSGDGSPPQALLTLPGRGTAPGRACGPLVRNRPDLGPDAAAGAILVAERASPEDVGRIRAASGTLTLGGAPLSHVSLLSREMGKASVALEPAVARLVTGEPGLLELRDPSVDASLTLMPGEIVLLDGDSGTLAVPGGHDPERRRRARRAWHALTRIAAANDEPDPAPLVALLTEAGNGTDAGLLSFVLEAALVYRAVPPGASARGLVRALAGAGTAAAVRAASAELSGRLVAAARERAERLEELLRHAADLDELERLEREFAHRTGVEREALEDLGAAVGEADAAIARVRGEADRRRDAFREEIREQIERALTLPDATLRPRAGVLFRLLHRGRRLNVGRQVEALEAKAHRLVEQERRRAGGALTLPLRFDGVPPRSLVGAKAHGLYRSRAVLPGGCAVPEGFVITTAAYRVQTLGEAGERLRQAAADEDPVRASRRARAAFVSAPLHEGTETEIVERLDRLAGARLAVRSSSTVEDGKVGSFAGYFDTYLGVLDAEELIERVRTAWGSLWDPRALALMAEGGLSPLDAAQAVLVQRMVGTRAAGVMFSRDPGGRPDTLLVNAAWGLGEGISQGDIDGDLYRVRRSDGETLRTEPSSGTTQIVLDPERTGTLEVELPRPRLGRPCLTAADLARLAELARALEDATGRRQDVEFGIDDEGVLWVFQVRRVSPEPGR